MSNSISKESWVMCYWEDYNLLQLFFQKFILCLSVSFGLTFLNISTNIISNIYKY